MLLYRCVCVFEIYSSPYRVEVKIEVCQGNHIKSLPPLIRKVDIDELVHSCIPQSQCLLPLMNQMGMVRQPFRISGKPLLNPIVQRILLQNPWHGVQYNGKGSIKNTIPTLPMTCNQSILKGHLLGGELYITNILCWNKNIKIRLTYQDAICSFFPQYNSCPYLTTNGTLLLRDKEAEERLMATLPMIVEGNVSEISLDNLDIDELGILAKKGWKIFVEKINGSTVQVYLRHHPSGINWFASDSSGHADNIIIEQMLNNYLQGRNYTEYKGNVIFFRSNDITHVDTDTISESLPSLDLRKLYGNHMTLTESEQKQINQTILMGVKAELRPYQKKGVYWLAMMRKNQHGCLLADEMGLGKTLQVLAHLYSLGDVQKPHLVIAPTSLVYNWLSEANNFLPSWQNDIGVQLHKPDVTKRLLIVSYDILRLNIEAYNQIEFDTIIIDEAQIIKNRETKKYQAIKTLKSLQRILLTGTPIENSIDDIWSHFMILIPEMKSLYVSLSRQCKAKTDEGFLELSRKFLKPFILRRTKQEVLRDLPSLIEKTIYIEMSKAERHIYDNVHKMVLLALTNGTSGRIESIALEGLLRLRQVCVSTKLIPNTIYNGVESQISTKLHTALEYINVFREKGEKVLFFSQFVGALEEMEQILSNNRIQFVKIYGETRDRITPIERFKKEKDVTVFLISIKAGGVGLNLTVANNVILLDDWWNPAVEDQAFARAHRIGQKQNVLVLRLICKDTVEEKVLKLQDKKRQTIDLFNAASSKLSMDEIQNLLE